MACGSCGKKTMARSKPSSTGSSTTQRRWKVTDANGQTQLFASETDARLAASRNGGIVRRV